jgi:hypothetical protein
MWSASLVTYDVHNFFNDKDHPKVWSAPHLLAAAYTNLHHHHHQITKLSHSINAIGPAPHRSGRNLHIGPCRTNAL